MSIWIKAIRSYSTRILNSPYLLLVLITLIAALLRLYRLGQWSFWEDELFSIGFAEDGFNYSVWRRSLATDLIHLATANLGVSEWSARLVPALIGILSIPLLYLPVKKIFGQQIGLIFSALLSVSTWHLYWSQNARFYILLFLFYTLSMLTFYLALEEDNPWLMVLSLLFLGLAARERLVALVLVPVLLAYLILLKILPFEKPPGLRFRNLAIFLSPGLLAVIFFAGPYLRNFSGWLENFGRINNNPVWIFAASVYYIGLVTFFCAAIAFIYLLVRRDRLALFLGLGAGMPLLAIMAVSLFQFAATRYVFVSLASWLLLAGIAANELLQALEGDKKVLALGFLALLLLAPLSENFFYFRYQNGNRPDWRTALQFISVRKDADDLVIAAEPSLGEYYLQSETRGYHTVEIDQLSQFGGGVWFVEDMVVAELYPQKLAWIQEHARLMANFDVHANARNFKMRVYYYRSRE